MADLSILCLRDVSTLSYSKALRESSVGHREERVIIIENNIMLSSESVYAHVQRACQF